jgi:hypothetical protein
LRRPSDTAEEKNRLVVHVAHAPGTMRHRWCFRLRVLCDHGLGGNKETSNRSRILQRRAHDLGWIDDALLNEVAVIAGLGIVAEVRGSGRCSYLTQIDYQQLRCTSKRFRDLESQRV